MNKSRNKKKSTNPHISYKYIAVFCVTFAIFNFFVEKIASKNEGKNNPQIQNIRFNQVQSYKSSEEIKKSSKISIKNNFESFSLEERKKNFITYLLPIIKKANQDILEKRIFFFKVEKKIQNNNLNVLDNEGAKIGFVAWEGDSALAVNESLRINGNVIGNPPLNPSTNAFNGTNSFTGNQDLYNMDIDVYDLQNNIEIGDRRLAVFQNQIGA